MQLRGFYKVKEEYPESGTTIANELREGTDFVTAAIKLEIVEIKLPLINVKPIKCDCKEENQDFEIRLTDLKVKNKFKLHYDHSYTVCNKCPETFYYKKDLVQHRQKDHPVAKAEKKSKKCEICSKICSDQRAWQQHQRVHSDARPFPCDESSCHSTFKREYELYRHRQLVHLSVRSLLCDICGNKFHHKRNLTLHIIRHSKLTEKPIRCLKCEKRFWTGSELAEHQSKHNDDRKFQCDKCGRMMKTKKQLKCHFATIHRQLKYIFPCGTCLKSFTSRSSLCFHQKRGNCKSGINKYHCATCLQTFRNEDRLVLHKTIRHEKPKYVNGTRMYSCSKCSKSYKNFKHLSRHLKSHGFGREAKVCLVCSKLFFITEAYNGHVKLHSSEKTRNFKCHLCPKSFRFNSGLAVHVKNIHARGFFCDICNHRASRRHFLVCHFINIHGKMLIKNHKEYYIHCKFN